MFHTGNNDRWSIGADDNNNQNFKISQGGATGGFGTNDFLTIARTTGAVTFQNSTNSDTAFRVLNSPGSFGIPVFQIDTSNHRVYIGNPLADNTGALLVLDTKNTSGDPAGINGSLYYNSNYAKMRCYEKGPWNDCRSVVRPNERRTAQVMAALSSTTWNGYGININNELGTKAALSGSIDPSIRYTSGSTSGDAAGASETNAHYGTTHNPLWQSSISPFTTTTSMRIG